MAASALAEAVLSALASEISNIFRNDLRNLQRTLELICAVISEAQRHQVNDSTTKLWLRKLKGIVYDADDVIDDFSYEVDRRSENDDLLFKVMDFFSSSNYFLFRAKMRSRIKAVNEKLDKLSRLRDHILYGTMDRETGSERNQTTSLDCNLIVGREKDLSSIVDLLITSPAPISDILCQYEKLAVLPIVGMGGLGKTRLAQSIYCDESVKGHFDLRLWICEAGDFNLRRILVDILESITNRKYDNVNIEVMVSHVQDMLRGKRYLLVLDDLWNEDAKGWEKLISILMVGSEGCKVLVTTRKIHVAWIVQGITPAYRLKQLSANDCWLIIKQKAFSPGGAPENPEMVSIGKEIAEKCCGLPFAAAILGSVMRLRREKWEWLSIKGSEILEKPECCGSIKFTYDNLTSTLKQCFSYCSVFPRGWEIDRETVIQLWMAEGFLRPSGKGISMEDIGNEYFNSFLSQSLFQSVGKDEFGEIQKCKMHDLVYYLAQSVVDEDEWSVLKPNEAVNISEIRRLHLVSDEDTKKKRFPRVTNDVNKLRTFMAIEVSNWDKIERVFSNRNLRAIHLTGSSIQKLPASISKLRHLRYLNLSRCHNLDVLRSINSLYKLQTLVLHNCSALLKLPEDFGSIKDLRHLDLSYTRIKVLPNSVTNLCNMRTLDISYCKNFEELPEKIGAWKDLRSLNTSHTKVSVLPDSLTDLHKLVKLRLHSCPNLEKLPKRFGILSCSKRLDISGTKLATWIAEREITLETYLKELELELEGLAAEKKKRDLPNSQKRRVKFRFFVSNLILVYIIVLL